MTQAQNTILTYLDRLDPETRVEMAAHVKALVEHPGWNVFSKLLDDRIQTARDVVEFKLYPLDEYASQHGNIRGLRFAASIPGAVIESGERANHELRQIAARENT